MNGSTVAHDTFVIERSYDVPVTQVFRAWSDPQLKAAWFAGSADALGAGYELDFRVGGHEVNRGGPPGGPLFRFNSEYRDIVPDQRIVYTYEMFADEKRLSVSVATVQFDDQGATTRLVLTEQGAFLDGHDTVARARGGNPRASGIAGPGPAWEWTISRHVVNGATEMFSNPYQWAIRSNHR